MRTERAVDPAAVLTVLDHTASVMVFPMLDNGYVYPAAARLTVFSDAREWSIVIETFGFSPRAGLPHTCVTTFGSTIAYPRTVDDFIDAEAYARYAREHPNAHLEVAFPLEEGDWIDAEHLVPGRDVILRGQRVGMPDAGGYRAAGVWLADPPRVAVFEFARWLAHAHRDAVLATVAERRAHVPEGLPEVLRLDEWHHPDLADDELPSEVDTFRQLALVAATADPGHHRPTEAANTHWSNWPTGGTL